MKSASDKSTYPGRSQIAGSSRTDFVRKETTKILRASSLTFDSPLQRRSEERTLFFIVVAARYRELS